MTDRFDIEQIIRILGLEIRADQADEGKDFDVACRIALEKLRKCKEYADLEEQGLLLRLPCKVGDTVYELYRDGEYCVSWLDLKEVEFSLSYYERHKDKFGKTVFLTKEEAEQRLKELSK